MYGISYFLSSDPIIPLSNLYKENIFKKRYILRFLNNFNQILYLLFLGVPGGGIRNVKL